MKRGAWPRLLLGAAVPSLLLLGIIVRTPARRTRWLAEYEAAKEYLATSDANFDDVVRTRHIDLVALDSVTRR
ncbi:MAG TPA: hypothetical protein VL295_01810, partial [Gemmatimonadales bacterium]|nr:hypothetical protein [Gemmatimonadales bacterium]